MDAADLAHAREGMLAAIARDVRGLRGALGSEHLDPRVMRALERVPRHEFVPAALRGHAYENKPLPIGDGQTISQPFIVALMTDLLALAPQARVLEVGAGSGYQTAVLAELAAAVYAIEWVPRLAASARERLQSLGYANVELRVGDGGKGWPAHAPFDAVLIAAAGRAIPPALVEQLAPGGRLVAPRGAEPDGQELVVITKDAAGVVRERTVLAVAFVPLLGPAS
jgi:protein-L-isoaspartate(D-aspartate) O-methyltransferase